jgi:signal transduction histidine kinase
MTTLSLRARLTLWYTVALVVILGLFAADVLWIQARLGTRRVDRELDAVIATAANIVEGELRERSRPASAAHEAVQTVAAPGRALAILDAQDGQALAARWAGLDAKDVLPSLTSSAGGRSVWTTPAAPNAWRVHAETRTFGAATLRIIAGAPLQDVRREQREVQEAMMVGIPIALLLAAGGGLWLAGVGLRPITEMANRAARIPLTGMEDLGHTNRTDELGRLAQSFNGLVARLRSALHTQRQFMADASHELRTPVSVIRSAADVSLDREHRDEPQYRETLTIVSSQAQRLGRLVADMLVLARADAGGYLLRPVDLYLDELIAECLRAVGVIAAERGVTAGSPAMPEIPFRGDEELLRQLILNLLQNAAQHTPAGGAVGVDVRQVVDRVEVRVTDAGPGIPPVDQARIFDRFVQLDPARRGLGTGLGLPIARWIAEAHGGTLALECSGPGGSTFIVSLPMSSSVHVD